jgi:hypothetical protein
MRHARALLRNSQHILSLLLRLFCCRQLSTSLTLFWCPQSQPLSHRCLDSILQVTGCARRDACRTYVSCAVTQPCRCSHRHVAAAGTALGPPTQAHATASGRRMECNGWWLWAGGVPCMLDCGGCVLGSAVIYSCLHYSMRCGCAVHSLAGEVDRPAAG